MVVKPKSHGQLKIVYLEAKSAGKSILPCGLGHNLNLSTDHDRFVAISSRGLNQIESIEPDNLLAEVGAGLTLSELEKALAPTGLYWPITGPYERTLGGLMGQGLLGAETMAKGTMVDWILGTTMMNPAGEIVKSGGRTLKNVSGYDLTRLAWRARGSLVMNLSFILKLLPKPKICPVMEFSIKSLKLAASHMETIIKEGFGVQNLRLIGDDKGLRICLWLTGFVEYVSAQEEKLKSLLKDPSDLFEDGFEYFNHVDAIFNLPNEKIKIFAGSRKNLLETVRNLSWIGDHHFVVDLGSGRLALISSPKSSEDLAFESGLVLISGQVFQTSGPLFRRLKTAIDPKGLFATL
ncbi:MAG: FAD-binding oxidoreductase [Deltaproteobacteria bacterium]|jgi:FAD/FMN-containing dehydrogenase|nr:FAD-binding oxidoreductase [Deltaproteobacteria bacterium]